MSAVQGFVNGAYESVSRVMAGESCWNMFPEAVPQGGQTRVALMPVPGKSAFAELSDAPGRGIFTHKNRLFTVFGRTLYEVAADGTPTARGTVVADANPVTFDTNGDGGNQLMASSGDKGYILDLASNVFTTPLASGSTMCGQLDGFLVSLDAATSTFRISDSLDGNTWNGLQVAQRTSASDPWIAMIIARQEIFLFGNKTGEVWYNAGLPTFPFAQRPEGVFEVGIAATFSLAKFLGSIAFLGRTENGNPKVYVMDGYRPTPISDDAIEWAIQQYDDADGVSDAIGWSYSREGHDFYVLTFPKADRTWVYDGTTQKWHQRGLWSTDAADYLAYRPQFHAACFNKNLVCDRDSNKIYSLSSSVFTDVGGAELRRARRLPHIVQGHKKITFHRYELICDVGVGNANPPGDDPLVALRYSDNGGATWGVSRTRQVGKIGAADTRVEWHMCGAARDRVSEIWSSDPVATRWFNLEVDATVGRH